MKGHGEMDGIHGQIGQIGPWAQVGLRFTSWTYVRVTPEGRWSAGCSHVWVNKLVLSMSG
jgi:hypothetical protein